MIMSEKVLDKIDQRLLDLGKETFRNREDLIEFTKDEFGRKANKTLEFDSKLNGGKTVSMSCKGCDSFHLVGRKRKSGFKVDILNSDLHHYTVIQAEDGKTKLQGPCDTNYNYTTVCDCNE